MPPPLVNTLKPYSHRPAPACRSKNIRPRSISRRHHPRRLLPSNTERFGIIGCIVVSSQKQTRLAFARDIAFAGSLFEPIKRINRLSGDRVFGQKKHSLNNPSLSRSFYVGSNN